MFAKIEMSPAFQQIWEDLITANENNTGPFDTALESDFLLDKRDQRETRRAPQMAIIGAGYTGVMSAINLRFRNPEELVGKREQRNSVPETSVDLFDPSGEFGGDAYHHSAQNDEVLNIPSDRISEWTKTLETIQKRTSDIDMTFESWYQASGRICLDRSVLRAQFGEFLKDSYKKAAFMTVYNPDKIDLARDVTKSRIIDIDYTVDGTIQLTNQTRGNQKDSEITEQYDQVVLTTGYSGVKTLRVLEEVKDEDNFFDNPYDPKLQQALKRSEAKDSEPTFLIVGTGLSAYDAAIKVLKAKPKAKVTLVSRGGHVHPHYHVGMSASKEMSNDLARRLGINMRDYITQDNAKKITFKTFSRKLLEQLQEAKSENCGEGFLSKLENNNARSISWVDIINTAKQNNEIDELLEFYRENASLISTQRIGVVATIAQKIQNASDDGQLELIEADIQSVTSNKDGHFSVNLNGETHQFDNIVSATGKNTDVRHSTDPLIKNLLAKGWITPHYIQDDKGTKHETGLGIKVSQSGEVIMENGEILPGVKAAGVLTMGAIFAGEIAIVKNSTRRYLSGKVGPAMLNISGISETLGQITTNAYLDTQKRFQQYVQARCASTMFVEGSRDKTLALLKPGTLS